MTIAFAGLDLNGLFDTFCKIADAPGCSIRRIEDCEARQQTFDYSHPAGEHGDGSGELGTMGTYSPMSDKVA